MAEYRYVNDEAFSVESIRRLYAPPFNNKMPSAKTIVVCAVLMFVVVIGFAIEREDWWHVKLFLGMAAILAGIGIFILVVRYRMFAFVRRRFRESPLKDAEVAITLTLDGMHICTAESDSKNTWKVFSKADVSVMVFSFSSPKKTVGGFQTRR